MSHGEKRSAEAVQRKTSLEKEIDMMSADSEQTENVGKDGNKGKAGSRSSLTDVKPKILREPALDLGVLQKALDLLKPQFNEMAQNAADKAIAGITNKVIRLQEEISKLEKEKKELSNQLVKNETEIVRKEQEICSLNKKLQDMKKKLEEEKRKADAEKAIANKYKQDLSYERANHQVTRSQANVNMKKMKEKMRGSTGQI